MTAPASTIVVNQHEDANTVTTQMGWLNTIKGIALLWIILNHITERLFGSPYIANPDANWPPFGERIAQLLPLGGSGIQSILLNLLRYVGWSGDQGVQLFLIVSGFGLTWGLLQRQGYTRLHVWQFYRRRAERIYPLWWGSHLLFVATGLFVGLGISLSDPALYMSMVGIRMTPRLFYFFAPAWWYVGLLIQLYLAFPLLWEGLRRRGPLWLLITCCAIGFVARGIGLLFFGTYIDAWQRGAIFVTRLPEFAFGISLAAWFQQIPGITRRVLNARSTLLFSLVMYIAGTILSLSVLGMIFGPFLTGVSAFVLLCAVLNNKHALTKVGGGILTWIGRHSYALFLLHQPLVTRLVPGTLASSTTRILAGSIAALTLTAIGAIVLEQVVERASGWIVIWRRHFGTTVLLLRIGAIGAVLGSVLIGAEVVVRQIAPQEAFGWGERISLEPDSTVGWRLIPSQATRLRWVDYDYTITANSLGYPGPDYPTQKAPGTFRIMTTGDAFTSAEGVDTNLAWPRVLETNLAEHLQNHKVEVQNFAITGYGPNQYAAVISKYAPSYHPDLIIIEMFVNDYQDVLSSDDDFRASIGFDQPEQNGWRAILKLGHLRQLIHLNVSEPIGAWLQGKPSPPQGYFLGNFTALERNQPNISGKGRQLAAERLSQIKTVADRIDARVVIVMVPAAVQVCRAEQLAYYPWNVDLADSSRFDLDLPQRMTQTIAQTLGFSYFDLRSTLQSVGDCPYQPHNMHWTAAGHRAVADYLGHALVTDGYLRAR